MNAEKFAFYIKNPAHLYQITYTELKSLVLQYPYCQNLRYLLLKKSVLEKHSELEQNLQLAATYSSDRNFLYQQIKDGESYESEADSFFLKEEYIELKELGSEPVVEKQESIPSPAQAIIPEETFLPESETPETELSIQNSPEIPEVEEAPEIPAENVPEIIEEENNAPESTTIEEPEVLSNPELEHVQEQKIIAEPESQISANSDEFLDEIEEDEFDDITPDIADLYEDQLADLEIVSLEETVEEPLFEKEDLPEEPEEEDTEDGAISIEDLIMLDSLTPMERLEISKSKEKTKKVKVKKEEPKKENKTYEEDKKELDFGAMDALIEKTKKDVPIEITNKDFEDVTKEPKPKPTPKSTFGSWLKQIQAEDTKPKEETIDLAESKQNKSKKKRKVKKKTTAKPAKAIKQKEKKSKKRQASEPFDDQKAKKAKTVAEKSLKENTEIATETLAFLLVKQEKYKNAIKMYEKLSLIFPEKSSYFAEQIKKTKKLIA